MPSRDSVHSVGLQSGTYSGCVTSPITAVRLIYDKGQTSTQGMRDNESTESIGVANVPASGVFNCPDKEGAWQDVIYRLLYFFEDVAGAWTWEAAWDDDDDDGLVFNPQPSLTRPVVFQVGDTSIRLSHDLVINSDAKLSHNLWLFCILIALFAARSHYGASIGNLMGRAEQGPEAIASLTELKATLINIQGCVERLRHIHEGDSVEALLEGGGNHGSTSPPPLPHAAPSSVHLDYDTESEAFAQPAATGGAQPPTSTIGTGGTLIANTTASGMGSPRWDPSEPKIVSGQCVGTGSQDPKISASFSCIPQASSELPRVPSIPCHPMLQATGESYQEAFPSLMGVFPPRNRSPSADGERRTKRARRCSDAVVANREGRVDKLGNATPDSARVSGGQERDVSNEDEETYQSARLLARIVVGLCRDRYRPPTMSKELRGVGMTAAELGALLDVSVHSIHS